VERGVAPVAGPVTIKRKRAAGVEKPVASAAPVSRAAACGTGVGGALSGHRATSVLLARVYAARIAPDHRPAAAPPAYAHARCWLASAASRAKLRVEKSRLSARSFA
ncbi:MAG: hypothetical protein ACOC20_08135, partial [Oceanicaulis sp.]